MLEQPDGHPRQWVPNLVRVETNTLHTLVPGSPLLPVTFPSLLHLPGSHASSSSLSLALASFFEKLELLYRNVNRTELTQDEGSVHMDA